MSLIDSVPGEFRVVEHDLKSFHGNYASMDYGNPEDPRMQELREEFHLEQVISGTESEFDAFLALKRWLRLQWNHGWTKVQVTDGLDILRKAREGALFCCGHYALTYVDCARALGWPARTICVSVENADFPRDYQIGNIGHSIVEIWSNEYEKWLVLDPDLNVYYRRDGIPLNALEIRDAWLNGQANSVEMVQDKPGFVMPCGQAAAEIGLDMQYRRHWSEDTVHLTLERFARHRALDYYARVSAGGWDWVDGRVLPSFISHYAPRGLKPTSNIDDIYWSLNQTRISAKPSWQEYKAILKITLEHCMPYFNHFEGCIDNSNEWIALDQTFEWPMHEGINTLECRAVNIRRHPGIVSKIVVAYASPQGMI